MAETIEHHHIIKVDLFQGSFKRMKEFFTAIQQHNENR